MKTYGKILPKGSERYARPPIPAHPHLLRTGSQARGKVSRLSAGAAVSCPHALVPAASPCPSGLRLVLPHALPLSPPLPEGRPSPTVCCKAQVPSHLPALCGTYAVRCSLAAFLWVRAGCPECTREGPGCPSADHEGFLLLHFINVFWCFFF